MKQSILLLALLISYGAHADDYQNYAYGRNDYYQSGDYAQKQLNKRIDKALDSYQPTREESAYDKKREAIYEEARREIEAGE